ncbi:hypothetical protein M8C21_009659 [Ambrosia artemisiifolia]|uniref:Uncharacterized protein n=1 Tax=Ambrosia artemisiifolia TaxID=4212 RepID=A0AAD5GTF1_AMBAR|nr:hypothetical protein M8C21_009659 [Ambrosia artemisiifolia]
MWEILKLPFSYSLVALAGFGLYEFGFLRLPDVLKLG